MMEEENSELSLKLQCGEETVSLINPYPSRGSPISLRAFETSTTAYDNGQDMRSTPLGGKLKFETSLGHLTAASCGFVKREILDMDAVSCRVGRDESDDIIRGAPRKKLRLSNYQSSILELKFREQSTLSRKHKSALANMLNMEPRQVDVWFQNRRARTKLKRKEEEYEIMKRCCDTLREENIRLEREMQALRAMQIVQGEGNLSAAVSFIICPSCERLATKNSATATF